MAEGNPDFIRFVREKVASGERPPVWHEPACALAVVVAKSVGSQPVRLRIESSGSEVVAERRDFPPAWEFLVGDVVSVELSGPLPMTVPQMARCDVAGTVKRFMVGNKDGKLRLLCEDLGQ